MWAAEGISTGAVAVASVPAAVAFAGVVISTWLSDRNTDRRWGAEAAERAATWEAERDERAAMWEAERDERRVAREHEHTIERNRVLRADRLSLYRRLVDSGTAALRSTMVARMQPTSDELQTAAQDAVPWRAALAESLLIAPTRVIEAASKLEEIREDRYIKARVDSVRFDPPMTTAGQAMANYLTPTDVQMLDLMNQLSDEGNEILAVLIGACRADIEHMA